MQGCVAPNSVTLKGEKNSDKRTERERVIRSFTTFLRSHCIGNHRQLSYKTHQSSVLLSRYPVRVRPGNEKNQSLINNALKENPGFIEFSC